MLMEVGVVIVLGPQRGGLHISKNAATTLVKLAELDPKIRAQALSLSDWARLYGHLVNKI